MVKLVIKSGDRVQFLYETSVESLVDDVVEGVTRIYNGRLKVERIAGEMEQLADHGITLPPNMQVWQWMERDGTASKGLADNF